MKGRILIFALGLALLAAFLTRGAGTGPAVVPEPAGSGAPAPARATAPPAEPPSTNARDPFRYADEPSTPAPSRTILLPPPTVAAAPSPLVRLVGFVRAGGGLKAALSIAGEVVVAGVGERAAGYTVLAIDEETGVRLRDDTGAELALPVS